MSQVIAKARTVFKQKIEDEMYRVTFALIGSDGTSQTVWQINYTTLKNANASLQAVFTLNGKSFNAAKAKIWTADIDGNVLGSPVESTDTSSVIADGGSLYISKDAANVVCAFYNSSSKELCNGAVPIIHDGSKVEKTEYKYYISSSPNDNIDWSKITATTTPPSPKMAKGNYLYVMTIVTYSDGTETSTVTISYCGTDGDSAKVTSTSVTYAVTDDAKQPADSAFTYTSVPEVKDGQYLWCKTVVTYSDGKSTKSYAVSRVGSDGDQGYSLHFAYADSVTYSGNTPTVTGFSTTRRDSSEWLGVNRSLEVDDPTDPQAYDWTKIKGEKGEDVYRLEVISSAGLVYHNGSLNTVLSAHVWGPDGEVTDRCNGTFTWYDLRVSNSIGTGKTYAAQATSAVDAYHYRCIYNGEVSKETYNIVYNSKQLQYNGKNIQF